MYPNLYFFLRDLFGVEWKGLRFINMFGFFVALAFIAAAIVISSELKRKGKESLLHYEEQKIMVGQPATILELFINFLLGFILGYKIVGAFLSDSNSNIQDFIFSLQGNWTAGILLGLVFAGMKWWEKNKQKLASPEERTIRIWPHDRVGDIIIFGAIFGFIGAKIFDNLENWDRFIKDPIGNLLSPSGLTFYGGLICAALAIWWYARKHKIGFWQLNDAAAPSLMLAYSVGRIGCQVAGDGDWGITNFKPKPFSWLPDWIWAYQYPHNVNKEGILMPNCNWGEYCFMLRDPVYPTPLYEIMICFVLFLLIWMVRKKFKVAGTLFGFYLLLNGLERFFIEKIRVNTKYESLPFQPTQAEIISFLLILTGITLMIYLPRTARKKELV
jgi:phosphatidylglycerol---prolipoprotein diacylglyceryl transferase